jgi:hypothetical protein
MCAAGGRLGVDEFSNTRHDARMSVTAKLCAPRIQAAAALGLLGAVMGSHYAAASPLVLYDPTGSADPLTSYSTTSAQQCGSLSNPCKGLNASPAPMVPPPLGPSFEYGFSGELTAGVSNHGYGGGMGLSAWFKKDDVTLSIGLWTSADRYTGKTGYYLPYGPYR